MEVLFVCTLSFLLLILTYLFYMCFIKKSSGSGNTKKEKMHRVVVFIDAPDPDNPAAVAAVAKHVLTQASTDEHLHVVLTGRPVNLETEKADVFSLELLVRQKWEVNNSVHAHKVMEDAAVRLLGYLARCNVDVSAVTIYDGGVAPCAPLSDRFHEWDFLFDRKDLCTGSEEDRGDIVTPEEYTALVHKFNQLSQEDREKELLCLLRPFPMTSLSILRKKLEEEECGDLILFLGGPATALVELFTSSKDEITLRDKVKSVYGMFGALEPGKGTLLSNQFNVACDIEAACELLINDIFPQAKKYLIMTETAKNAALKISSDDLLGRISEPYFIHLQELWESVHGNKTQPLFDIFPVMAYLSEYGDCFEWMRQRAVLREWGRKDSDGEEMQQIFSFIEPDDSMPVGNGGLFVSSPKVHSLGKEDVLNFLQKSWT